ncbi:MAG: sensor histidine kinase [Elusimicrobiota bacterium]
MNPMYSFLGKKSKQVLVTEVLLGFIQSWERHGNEEISIASSALDVIHAYLGERPCCLWKHNSGSALSKLSERGMVEIFYSPEDPVHQSALKRVLVSGIPEFDPCSFESLQSPLATYDGLMHLPIRYQDDFLGILSLAVSKRESKSRDFVQPLESLAELIAICWELGKQEKQAKNNERRLKAEVDATTRELEQTNHILIDRVRELKTLYKELQKRVQELTNANKAKDEFLSIVSHELRTPLTSLTGFLAVLLDEEACPVNVHQKKFLGIAKQSAHRLNLIISDLLDISRIEAGRMNLEMGECAIDQILETSVEGLRATADAKGMVLDLDIKGVLPLVWADASRIQQVVDNLISNSIKFTDRNGHIEVFAEEKGDCVQVSVKDNGPGLSKPEQEKVFDMFYQADASIRRSTGGAGLGLAISRGIVNMHGGQIMVQSEKGQGATFTFLIPRNKNQQKAA